MSIISVQHSVMEMYQIQWEYFENQFQACVAQVNIILTVEKSRKMNHTLEMLDIVRYQSWRYPLNNQVTIKIW